MDQAIKAKLFSDDEEVRKEGIMEALIARDKREAEWAKEEEDERQAERAEAASLKISLGQLRQKKHDELNRAVMKNVHDIVPSEIRWLWPGKIPLGKVTLFSGDPDQGKSYVTLDIATRVSHGLEWPGEEEGTMGGEEGRKEGGSGEQGEGSKENAESNSEICNHHSAIHSPGSVILITSEDDDDDTIRPRLDAMGADTKKVEIISGIEREAYSAQFTLPRDLDLLEKGIKKLGDCKLVIIDPLASYLELNSGGPSSIRQALDPLKDLAKKTGVAVILVNHLSKGSGATLYRSLGSISIIGMCRTAWGFTRDKSDRSRRMMLPIKNNLSPDDSGFAFTILDGRVAWESEPVEISIDEAMKGEKRPTRVPEAVDAAIDWLQTLLADGEWKLMNEIHQLGNLQGLTSHTLKRAKIRMRLESKPASSNGPWQWRLRKTSVE
jgi:hypothetical protein